MALDSFSKFVGVFSIIQKKNVLNSCADTVMGNKQKLILLAFCQRSNLTMPLHCRTVFNNISSDVDALLT